MAELRDRLQSALGDAYRIERELGGGGMSRVFLAEEVRLSRQVVVKVLPPELAAGVSADRFEREIQLAAKLQHPHIVPLLTAGSQGDLLYYVMPHIAGESLRARIAHERALPIGETVRILRDVCDALAYAHGHGVVHRDATPDPVTQHRDSVPPALAALIMRCLAKHPADRPQSAEELLGQLEAMATPTGGTLPEQTTVSSGTAAALRRSHPVRVAALFGLAAVGVLALARLLVRLLGLPDWAFAGAVGLAAAGLPVVLWTGVIERRLAQSRVVRLLDAAAVGQALGRMGKRPGMALDVALARELAEREGAKAVVHGQIAAVGRGYVLSAELVSAPDGATLVALREDAKD